MFDDELYMTHEKASCIHNTHESLKHSSSDEPQKLSVGLHSY